MMVFITSYVTTKSKTLAFFIPSLRSPLSHDEIGGYAEEDEDGKDDEEEHHKK